MLHLKNLNTTKMRKQAYCIILTTPRLNKNEGQQRDCLYQNIWPKMRKLVQVNQCIIVTEPHPRNEIQRVN